MARSATFVVLAVLAAYPLVALARSSWMVDDITLNVLPSFTEEDDQPLVVPANDDHLIFSIMSTFHPDDRDLCMDLAGTNNVVMNDCEQGKASQLWYINDTFVLSASHDKCLDVCNGPACHKYNPPAVQVIEWGCHGWLNQQFTTDGNKIISTFNNNCLDVCNGNGCQPWYDVITFRCHGWLNQRWEFLPGGYTGPSPTADLRSRLDGQPEMLP